MLNFAPDLDPTTPEVFTDVVNLIPTQKGYTGSYTGVATSYPALAAACRNVAIVRKLDNTRRLFATTQTNIYEGSSGAWTARAAGTPDIGSTARWALGQFGDYTLATAKTVNLQASTTGAFSAVSGAPKATCLATGQGFVMLADYNDGSDVPDGWYCSGIYDHTVWTTSTTTQCTKGRLVDTPGPITGLSGYGSTFVAFKQDSMYLANYVGAPTVFQWQLIPGVVGCRSKDAITTAGQQIYFMGNDNFYTFDGSRPIPIGNPLREWFFKTEVNPAYLYLVVAAYDQPNQFIWFHYPSKNSQTLDRALVYHITTGRWGKVHLSVEAAANYISDPVYIDDLGTYSATIDGFPDIAFDSPIWTNQSQVMSYVDTSHVLKTFTGNCDTSSFVTGSFGGEQFTTVKRVRPRFIIPPTSATLQHQYDNDYGDSWTNGPSSTLSDGKFDLLWSARWHRGQVSLVGPWEMISYTANIVKDGEE